MVTKPTDQLWADIDLRGGEAVWVLLAHLYALLVPVALCVAVYEHWGYLSGATDRPSLFFVAACLLTAGSAFEVAQNTMDRWYLTENTASANGIGLCDLLFYVSITAGQAVIALAIGGDSAWVVVVAVASVIAVPPLYLMGGRHFAALGVASLLAMVLAFRAFGDPIVFVQLLLVAATAYFFSALLTTGSQALHGFTTLAASSGTWFLIWAIADGADDRSSGWLLTASLVAVAVGVGLLLRPWITRLPVSPRPGVVAT